jgi:hypothetical protein
MAREHSPALYGPDARTVFGPISPQELRRAARRRLREWAKWAAVVPDEDRAWFNERAHQAYVTETICRGLQTAASGTVPTKRTAVRWALASLPEEWRSLIGWSQQHRMDDADDEAMVPEVMRFIEWAANSTRAP